MFVSSLVICFLHWRQLTRHSFAASCLFLAAAFVFAHDLLLWCLCGGLIIVCRSDHWYFFNRNVVQVIQASFGRLLQALRRYASFLNAFRTLSSIHSRWQHAHGHNIFALACACTFLIFLLAFSSLSFLRIFSFACANTLFAPLLLLDSNVNTNKLDVLWRTTSKAIEDTLLELKVGGVERE